MKKYKIYLETTLFNYYFDSDRIAHAETVQLFKDIAAGKYEAYTSDTVMDELKSAPEPKKTKMLDLFEKHDITLLTISDSVENLADFYVEQSIVPKGYRTDAVHIAVAVVNNVDFIISMNFKHIVKPKTKRLINAVNMIKGYNPVEIISPLETIE